MSDCPPSRLYVGDNIAEILPLLLAELKRHGASVSGSRESGSFSISTPVGSVAGSFSIAGKSLAIEITRRPGAVSCGQLESKLLDYILDARATLKNR